LGRFDRLGFWRRGGGLHNLRRFPGLGDLDHFNLHDGEGNPLVVRGDELGEDQTQNQQEMKGHRNADHPSDISSSSVQMPGGCCHIIGARVAPSIG
jgi:hypothetical protein